MSISSTVCRLLLMFLVVNCLQQVHGVLDNDRAAILALAKKDPCMTDDVRNGDRNAMRQAEQKCTFAFRLFRGLTDHEKAFCKNARDPQCALTRGENGYYRCTFECDVRCSKKTKETVGSGRKAKTVTVWKEEITPKRQELQFIAEPVKKPPRGTEPTDLSGGDGSGPSGYGGFSSSGAGPSGYGGGGGGSGYGRGGYGGYSQDDLEGGFGRWSIG